MRVVSSTAIACALAACLACGKSGEEVPPNETQSVTPPQAMATPERVQGCLRAGEASGTFVLTAGAADTKMGGAATYQLLGTPEALQPHVGKRVEVTGTIVSEQTAQSRGATMPAEERAKGTTGTPTVQSSTEIEVKRLQVSGVTPVAGECGDR
ncbi:MAG: hypothetical protein WD690_14350 [Vicinamibacterales bacterium]